MARFKVVYGWYDDCEKQVEYFDDEDCEDAESDALEAMDESRGWCDWCAVYNPRGTHIGGFDNLNDSIRF